ncbi:hypothetical protein PRIPAC_78311 [Pristionchus pacificus]|uniref:Uncharacterized protein n=1 Tax=Pristionchus pacificus TaxID=54126 RepID=A0A2A6C228_PRIPA|nr:hypothetical protein PRIPAC_78311 [Pristionchus pacificus]|eukprot:PDM72157.1 hypothetical protein PRIPAC_38591 [Pristionchus pacificus]
MSSLFSSDELVFTLPTNPPLPSILPFLHSILLFLYLHYFYFSMLIRFLPFFLLFIPSILSLNCRTCASRDFLGATIFPVLQSFGAGNLIPPTGNCSDNSQVCPTTNYCFKREDTYEILDGSLPREAHFNIKGCDINAVAGSTVAYQLNKCVKYDEQKLNGYKVTRRICACNDKDLCNDSLSLSLFSSFLILIAISLFNY